MTGPRQSRGPMATRITRPRRHDSVTRSACGGRSHDRARRRMQDRCRTPPQTASGRCAATDRRFRSRRSKPTAAPWRAMRRCSGMVRPRLCQPGAESLCRRRRRVAPCRGAAARTRTARAATWPRHCSSLARSMPRSRNTSARRTAAIAEVRSVALAGIACIAPGASAAGQCQRHGGAAALDRLAGARHAPRDGRRPPKRDASCGSAISVRSSARATG